MKHNDETYKILKLINKKKHSYKKWFLHVFFFLIFLQNFFVAI